MKHRRAFAFLLCTVLFPSLGTSASNPATNQARDEGALRAFFATYLQLHAAKDMENWQALFLPQAICVRTGSDGVVEIYPIAELARSIAETARTLRSQHETFEDVRIELYGDVAVYSTRWTLFHNGEKVRQGRAFFSLFKQEGRWRIAGLVWYRD